MALVELNAALAEVKVGDKLAFVQSQHGQMTMTKIVAIHGR